MIKLKLPDGYNMIIEKKGESENEIIGYIESKILPMLKKRINIDKVVMILQSDMNQQK